MGVKRSSVKEMVTSGGERAAKRGRARFGIRAFSSTAGTMSSIFTEVMLTIFSRRIQFYFANWEGEA
jgi:hypothetical protein